MIVPVCPDCRSPVDRAGGASTCRGCGRRWPDRDGFPGLVDEAAVVGTDRLLRPFYDHLPRLHDPAVRWTLPLFGSGTERELRDGYLALLEGLGPGPVRLLDVGVGTGADLDPLAERLPTGSHVWGVDLSPGMLALARARRPRLAVDLLLADAHRLPFADAQFDAVLHVGAVNSFRDPRAAIAEMARVARPGAPVVLVDERLDPARRHSPVHRAIFRAICFYRPYPPDPRALLPAGAVDVVDRQPVRFFYALRFRVNRPAPASPAAASAPGAR